MADGGALNIKELLRQLGIKDVNELAVLKSVQPTLPVGDGSALTTPLLPAFAILGGRAIGNTTTTNGALRIVAAPTGTYIRTLSLDGTTATTYRMGVVLAGTTSAATSAAVNVMNMGPKPVVSAGYNLTILTAGIFAANVNPQIRTAASSATILNDPVFIPGGHVFEVHALTNNLPLGWAAVIQDAEAALTPSG